MIQTVLDDSGPVVGGDHDLHLALRVSQVRLQGNGWELVGRHEAALVTEQWSEEVGQVHVVTTHETHQDPAKQVGDSIVTEQDSAVCNSVCRCMCVRACMCACICVCMCVLTMSGLHRGHQIFRN